MGAACWGLICLHRALGECSFTADDARLPAALAPVMADELRRSLVAQAAFEGAGEVGVILLAEDLSLLGMSGQAERWLGDIADEDWPSRNELPPVLLGVAGRLRAAEAGSPAGAAEPSSDHVRRLAAGAGVPTVR